MMVNFDATGRLVPPWQSPVELRKLPREVQEQILANSAELAGAETGAETGAERFLRNRSGPFPLYNGLITGMNCPGGWTAGKAIAPQNPEKS
jgi:hypothetical protein